MRKVVTSTRIYDTVVLLVAMTSAQVAGWKWVGDEWKGEDPVLGWEVRDVTGALLGVVLPLGHMATRIHAEWYDPQADDFFFAGVTNAAVLKQGVNRVLEQRGQQVGPVPTDEDFAPERPRPVRNKACPFNYCFDSHCIDHGPVWAGAA